MKWLVSVFGCLVFIGVVLTTGFWLPAPTAANGRSLLTYDQFISISLTAITVVLAVIALLMAYLAFEGKNQIIDKAREVAEKEFLKMKPQLIQELKMDASEQLMLHISQEREIYEASTKSETLQSPVNNVPEDLEELKNA